MPSPCFLARLSPRETRELVRFQQVESSSAATASPSTMNSSTWTVEGVGAQLRLRHINQCNQWYQPVVSYHTNQRNSGEYLRTLSLMTMTKISRTVTHPGPSWSSFALARPCPLLSPYLVSCWYPHTAYRVPFGLANKLPTPYQSRSCSLLFHASHLRRRSFG